MGDETRTNHTSLPVVARPSHVGYRTYKRRWLVLISYCLLNATNGILWIGFATISDQVQDFYGVSNTWVSSLSVIFFIAFIPSSFVTAVVVHKWGLKYNLWLGAALNFVGCCVRLLSAIPYLTNYHHHNNDSSVFLATTTAATPTPTPTPTPTSSPIASNTMFYILLAGQLLPAIAQPCFTNIPALLAGSWFGANERDIAVVLGAASNVLGIATGQVLPAMVVTKQDDLPLFLLIELIISFVTSTMCFICVRSSAPPTPPTRAAVVAQRHHKAQQDHVIESHHHHSTHSHDHSDHHQATNSHNHQQAIMEPQLRAHLLAHDGLGSASLEGTRNSDLYPSSTTLEHAIHSNSNNNSNTHLAIPTEQQQILLRFPTPPSTIPSSPPSPNHNNSDTHNSKAENTTLADLLMPVNEDIKVCVGNADFRVLMLCFGCGLGLFNAISTLIQNIADTAGYSSTDAGVLGGVMIASGMISCIVFGVIMDATHWYNPLFKILFAAATVSFAFLYTMLRPNNFTLLAVAFGACGAFVLPLLPISFECGAESTFPVSEDVSGGLLLAGGQVTGIAAVYGLQALINLTPHYKTVFVPHAIVSVCSLAVLAVCALKYNGRYNRLAADKSLSIAEINYPEPDDKS